MDVVWGSRQSQGTPAEAVHDVDFATHLRRRIAVLRAACPQPVAVGRAMGESGTARPGSVTPPCANRSTSIVIGAWECLFSMLIFDIGGLQAKSRGALGRNEIVWLHSGVRKGWSEFWFMLVHRRESRVPSRTMSDGLVG